MAESFINIHNYFYISHPNVGIIYLMCIHLPGSHYDVRLFHPQAFVSERSLPTYFVFSRLLLDDMQLLSSTSPGCLYRLEFILFTLRQVVSGLTARFFSVSRSF